MAEYRRDEVGEWDVDLPRSAPCAAGQKRPCEIGLHLYRERRTGPQHPLAVICCRTHGCFFTIYPPGFVPYGRRRLPRRGAEVDEAPALQAVHDAADDQKARWLAWSSGRKGNAPGWASTQWRHIARWGRTLGLTGPQTTGQQIATSLGIPLHEHAVARAQYQRRHFRHRGCAVLRVLRAVSRVGGVLRRLLRAAYIAGLVGRGFAVDAWGRQRPLVPV